MGHCKFCYRGDEEKEPMIRKTGAPEFDAMQEPGYAPRYVRL